MKLFNRLAFESVNKKAGIYISIIILLVLVPLFIKSIFHLHVLIITFIFIIMSSSLRLIAISGQISMGHGGMMSIGAYTSAVLAKELGLSPFCTIPLGAVVTFIFAYLAGIPFSRLRGLYFCMITLFFGLGILSVVQMFTKYTGGYAGLTMIPPLFSASKLPYYYSYLLLCVISLLVIYRLEISRLGVTWKAISQSYSVASSIGINESRQRVLVFAIGSFFAGLAGAAFAHYSLVISQSNFGFLASINIIIYMLAGGILSFNGPIVGTAILVILPMLSLSLKYYSPYVFIGILLFVLLFARNGIVGLPQQIWLGLIRLRTKDKNNLLHGES